MQHHVQWRRLARVVVTLVTSLLLLAPPVQAGPMATSGQFNVSERGAATYSIPIQVPPGTAGIEPKLALNYNSQGGNGLLGMGWGLSGFSAISHCPKTVAQDGANVGISYDTSVDHRYCLDGQRLIAISGSYGAEGTEYRTERESFTKIISHTTTTNDPAWFQVWTKSGQVMEYGHTVDSRIEAQGKTVARLWALNKVSDADGNYQTYTYTEDATNGDYYPSRIDYTGNANTSLTPNNSVQFVYEMRPDIVALYPAGSLLKNSVRLTKVQAYQGTTLTKEYRATYDVGAISKRSRLKTVAECDGSNVCLPPLTMTLQDGGGANTATNNAVQIHGADWQSTFATYHGDFNGDGIADLMLVGAAGTYFCPGPGIASANNCAAIFTGYDWRPVVNIYVGDFNGDGISDLYLVGNTTSYFCPGPGIATTNNCAATITNNDLRSAFTVYVGDFNGDGVSDVYLMGSTVGYFCAGPGIASTNNCVQTFSGDMRGAYATYVGDFNGDGVSDIYLMGSTAGYFCAGPGVASTNNCVQVFTGDGRGTYGTYVGDFNGDGVSDIYLMGSTSSYFCAGPGVASVNNCAQVFAGDMRASYAFYVGDYNGDGISDLYLVGSSASYFCPGPGVTSVNNCVQTVTGNWQTYSIYPDDYNGDGSTDLYLIGTGGTHFAGGVAAKSDAIISISSGLGAPTNLTYKPLTNGTVYTKDSTGAYPLQNIQAPLYVVSSATTSNGIGGVVTQNYLYGGAKVDLSGRGFLGFRWTQATSPDTGLTSRTDYRQDWPYVGLPATASKTLPGSGNGGQLDQVSNTYACTNPQSGAACTVAIGNRYFPYLSQSIKSAWDLNGAALPVVTTTQQFDNYGNPTQIVSGTADGYSTTTTNTYSNDTTKWYLGRLTRSIVASTTPDAPASPPAAPTLPSVTLASVSPNTGPLAGGTVITLSGSNFAAGATATIGGVPATNCDLISTTAMTCTTPASSTGGPKAVVVSSNGKTATLANGFSYPSVTITTVSPNWSPLAGGVSFTITGNYFASGATVTVGGVAATGCSIASATSMTCTTPANSAGAKDVIVNSIGTSATKTGAVWYGAMTINLSIAANTNNYNLKSAAIAAGWNQIAPLIATVTINSGVTVGTYGTGAYAFDTDTAYPVGSSLTLINNGTIAGAGGAGGPGGGSWWNVGGAGGPALRVQTPITITNNGTIGGGGGGGAAAFYANGNYSNYDMGGGAGGGAGTNPGAGGAAGYAYDWRGSIWSQAGTAGTATAGGASGYSFFANYGLPVFYSGYGGGLGQSGTSAGYYTYGTICYWDCYPYITGYVDVVAGAAPGSSVVGNGYISWVATGALYGPIY